MNKIYISIFMFVFAAGLCRAQSPTENYIMTETMLNEDGTKSIKSVQYYDGYGRPSLLVSNGIKDSQTTNFVLQTYDGNGREWKRWLPIAGTGLTYNASITDELQDPLAFSQTEYDALDRPVFIATPGSDMAGNGKLIEYTTNTAESVKHYVVSGNTLSEDDYYSQGTLACEKTTDEDGKTIEVYKDLLGNVVLERRDGNNDTYYVYDDILRLRYVLPPMFQESGEDQEDNIALYAYSYNYDGKGRVTEKKLPGCEPVSFCYDMADRMVSSKDGNDTIHFYLYDILGRQVIMGRCDEMTGNDVPCLTMRMTGNAGFENTGYEFTDPSLASYVSNPVIETVTYYDNYDFLGIGMFSDVATVLQLQSPCDAHGLQTGSFMMASDSSLIHSVMYYDEKGRLIDSRELIAGSMLQTLTEYSFTGKPLEITQNVKKGTAEYEIVEYSFYNADTDKLERTDIQFNGAAPNSKVSEFVYDELGRIEMRKNSNGIYETSYGYNVRGNMTEMASESLLEDCTIFREQLEYTTSVGSGTPCYNGNISSMTWKAYSDNVYRNYDFEYDGLNRMTAAYYGEGASPYNITATNGYQELITYNANSSPVGLIRYGRTNTNVMGVIDNLAYEYNGNQLASINDGSDVSLIYRGSFDFKDKTQDASEYEYDSNGNMTKDNNKGITNISYDAFDHPVKIMFSDGSRTEYVYSPDGTKLRASYLSPVNNLEADQTMILNNVQINSIAAVNSASLPISSPTNTSTTLPAISTSFSPTTLVTENPELLMSTSATEYLGNFIFENGRLDKVMFDGGYVKISPTGAWTYHYYFTDHLGSVRVVGDGGGDVEQVNHYYPYGGLIGNLSTNPDKQKYKYNGKEYDTMHGLNTYDYGARQYDGTKIVWDRMDKYCEKYYNINPYVYCAGNPIRFIDPNGMEVRDGVGPYCADDRNSKALAKDLAAHNDPNSIMIVAHGVYENENFRFATSIDIQTYNPSTKEWNHNLISDGKQLDSFLSANSKTWKDYKNGKISAKDLHIVFYSCGSSAVVTEMSKDKAFKDVTFIAPDRKVRVTPDASIHVGDNTKHGYKEGKWHTIKNGKEPKINGNYDGKEKPGTKNFKYEKTYWLF